MLAECEHSEVVWERRRCVAAVHQLVATMDVSDYAKKIMGLSWALDAEGCVRDRSTEEGMQELGEWLGAGTGGCGSGATSALRMGQGGW